MSRFFIELTYNEQSFDARKNISGPCFMDACEIIAIVPSVTGGSLVYIAERVMNVSEDPKVVLERIIEASRMARHA